MSSIGRRNMMRGALALGLAAGAPSAAAAMTATPRQTAGPFYPRNLPLDSDNDLVSVQGHSESAKGEVLHLFGRVLDQTGRAMTGLRVEIWQCDAFGRYHHPRDGGGEDPNFQGFGKTRVDGQAAYRFRTIKPVAYTGRTPHIHFLVAGQGIEALTTQMYVAGDPQNERDFLYRRLGERAQEAVTVTLNPAPEIEPGALVGQFDIVLDERLLPD